jgi:hypothetical protein
MKLRLLSFSLSALILTAGALFTSCTQTNTPATTTTDDRSKVISSSTDTYTDVSALSDTSLYEFTVAGSTSATVLTGFSSYTNGTIRVFWTRGSGDAGADTVYYKKATGTTADAGYKLWATADETTGPNSDGTFRIYETSDPASGHPSGLILGPTTSTLSVGDASAAVRIDVVLATDNSAGSVAPHLALVSADDNRSLITGTPRAADFGSTDLITGGIDLDFLSTDITGIPSGPTSAGSWAIPANNLGKSAVVPIRTADNHYARVEIIPQTGNGGLLFGNTGIPGTPTNKYFVDVKVVYQQKAGWGYVARPEVRRAVPTLRTAAPTRILN